MKLCGKCKRNLPLTEFHQRHDKPGTKFLCIGCERVVYRARYALGLYPKPYKYRKQNHSEYKRAAKDAVLVAIRKGILIHQPCSECGATKADGHHEDYSKLLEVEWLCRRCHLKRHRLPADTPYTELDERQAEIDKRKGK